MCVRASWGPTTWTGLTETRAAALGPFPRPSTPSRSHCQASAHPEPNGTDRNTGPCVKDRKPRLERAAACQGHTARQCRLQEQSSGLLMAGHAVPCLPRQRGSERLIRSLLLLPACPHLSSSCALGSWAHRPLHTPLPLLHLAFPTLSPPLLTAPPRGSLPEVLSGHPASHLRTWLFLLKPLSLLYVLVEKCRKVYRCAVVTHISCCPGVTVLFFLRLDCVFNTLGVLLGSSP